MEEVTIMQSRWGAKQSLWECALNQCEAPPALRVRLMCPQRGLAPNQTQDCSHVIPSRASKSARACSGAQVPRARLRKLASPSHLCKTMVAIGTHRYRTKHLVALRMCDDIPRCGGGQLDTAQHPGLHETTSHRFDPDLLVLGAITTRYHRRCTWFLRWLICGQRHPRAKIRFALPDSRKLTATSPSPMSPRETLNTN